MPENRGNAVSYAGGTTHRPLPSATDKTYRDTHDPQPPKPTSTFNWDWNKTACSSCATNVATGSLVDGVCRTCRGEPEVAAPAPTREAYSPYEDDELDTIYQPGHELPDVPDLPEADPVDDPTAEADPVAEPELAPAARVARELRTPRPPPAQGVDLLEECIQHAERTFRAAHGIQDPLVGILRTAALSAIAALDFYVALHCTDSRGTARPPTDGAASTTGPATTPRLGGDQPAAVRVGKRGSGRPRSAGGGVRRPAVEVDEAAVVLEYAAGDSAPAIGRRHGVLPKRIRQILTAHHVQLRDDRAGHSGGHRKVWDQAAIDDVVRRYNDGATIADLARDLTVGRRQIAECLRDAGATLRSPVSVTSPIDDDTKAEILRRYVQAEETLNQVAAAMHLRVERVKAVVVAADIPVRPRGGAPRELLSRLDALGVTSHDVKVWAVEQGLIGEIARGMVPGRLVDAYVAAHLEEGPAA